MKLFYICGLLFICGCKGIPQQADYIYHNGRIITMNDSMSVASAMVVKDGKIIAIGNENLLANFKCKPENLVDLKLQYVYPGLIDAHCHFYGYAKSLMTCNLVGTHSWKEVLHKLDSFKETSTSVWLIGRGWDQNDWIEKIYPDNEDLNVMFPDRPVILKRIDGHAAICNQKALSLAGIGISSKIDGGEFIIANGKLTGVLVDNAVDLVEKFVIKPPVSEMVKALQSAEAECFRMGLTTLADAGLELQECLFLDSISRNKELSIFLYLMLNPTEAAMQYARKNGIYETDHTKICSFKIYADGALGSRGAKMKKDYCDRKNHNGLMLNSVEFFIDYCSKAYSTTEFQVCTHCIGDSANKLILDIYGKYLKGKNDRRWRIEHAQIIDTNDIELFMKYSVIPSVQPTHATSDAPWLEERLCKDRMKGAYAYKSLLNQNGYIPLGTDFPVEYINPIFTFYSAVFRKNANKLDQAHFQPEESLTPEQALKGMTIWAARACKLEHRKGSLEKGKDADFIILNQDLMNSKQDEVLNTKVLHTYRMGMMVF